MGEKFLQSCNKNPFYGRFATKNLYPPAHSRNLGHLYTCALSEKIIVKMVRTLGILCIFAPAYSRKI